MGNMTFTCALAEFIMKIISKIIGFARMQILTKNFLLSMDLTFQTYSLQRRYLIFVHKLLFIDHLCGRYHLGKDNYFIPCAQSKREKEMPLTHTGSQCRELNFPGTV
jgi:hypothetical protein